jgi:hypothetical protein
MSEIKEKRQRVKKAVEVKPEAMPVETPAVSPVAETAPAVVAPKPKRVLTPEAREKLLANLMLAREAKKAKALEKSKASSL